MFYSETPLLRKPAYGRLVFVTSVTWMSMISRQDRMLQGFTAAKFKNSLIKKCMSAYALIVLVGFVI